MEKKDIKKIEQEVQEFVITGIDYKNFDRLKSFVKELIDLGVHDNYDRLFKPLNEKPTKDGEIHNMVVTIDNINKVTLSWSGNFPGYKYHNLNDESEVIKNKIIKILRHFEQDEYRVVTNTTTWLSVVEKSGDVHFIWNIDRRKTIKTLTSEELNKLMGIVKIVRGSTIFGNSFGIDKFHHKAGNGIPALTVDDIIRVHNTVLRLNGDLDNLFR